MYVSRNKVNIEHTLAWYEVCAVNEETFVCFECARLVRNMYFCKFPDLRRSHYAKIFVF